MKLTSSQKLLIFPSLLFPFFYPLQIHAQNSVVITEIMKDPSVVSDYKGEWFEIYNNSDSAVDINGWNIKDNDSDSYIVDNGSPLIIDAGSYAVLCRNKDETSNGGVLCAYTYKGSLANSMDEVILLDSESREIDRVEYDSDNFPDKEGISMELISATVDNNLGSNWHLATEIFGMGDRGTPGKVNSSAPTPTPTKTPIPTTTPKPSKSPAPTETPAPTKTPKPSKTPKPLAALREHLDNQSVLEAGRSAKHTPIIREQVEDIALTATESVLGKDIGSRIDFFLPTASPSAFISVADKPNEGTSASEVTPSSRAPRLFFLLGSLSLTASVITGYKISRA